MNGDTFLILAVACLGVLATWVALGIWLDLWFEGGLSRWVCSKRGHVWTEDAPDATVVFETCNRCGRFKRAVLAREMGRAHE